MLFQLFSWLYPATEQNQMLANDFSQGISNWNCGDFLHLPGESPLLHPLFGLVVVVMFHSFTQLIHLFNIFRFQVIAGIYVYFSQPPKFYTNLSVSLATLHLSPFSIKGSSCAKCPTHQFSYGRYSFTQIQHRNAQLTSSRALSSSLCLKPIVRQSTWHLALCRCRPLSLSVLALVVPWGIHCPRESVRQHGLCQTSRSGRLGTCFFFWGSDWRIIPFRIDLCCSTFLLSVSMICRSSAVGTSVHCLMNSNSCCTSN